MDFGAVHNEFTGSFLLTLGGFAAHAATGVNGALAVGVGYAVMRQVFKKSKGHFNPSVSLFEALSGNLEWPVFGQYFLGQFLGAVLGGIVAAQLTLDDLKAGAVVYPAITDNHSTIQALIVEILFTLLFVLVVGASTRNSAGNLVVGLALYACLSFTAGISGGSLNLTDTLGRFIGSATVDTKVDVNWDDIWVYIVGPFAGAALAAVHNKVVARFEEVGENTPLKDSEDPKTDEP